MKRLAGKVAVVTGASRGIGRGIAISLGAEGATVYVTGRSRREGDGRENLPGTVFSTAEAVSDAGGVGIAIPCDHYVDKDVEAVFDRLRDDAGGLDILVNNAWDGYRDMVGADGRFNWLDPFWQQPVSRWDAMFGGGVRPAFVASRQAVPLMFARGGGLIVNISYWAGRKYLANLIYGVAKAAVDRMTADMAHDLRDKAIAVVALYPGLARTEAVMANAQYMDLSNSETPEFTGRAIAALASDPDVLTKSGRTLVSAELALEYGFADIDGNQPRPLTLETA